jgi:hypothetical protein
MFRDCYNLNYIKCLATDLSAASCTSAWVENVSSTGTFIKLLDMNEWSTGTSGIPEGWSVEEVEILYVTFTAQEDNSGIGLVKLSTNQRLEYSTDTCIWNTFNTTTNVHLNNGDKLYVRGVLNEDNTSADYTQFKMSGKIAASDNCNALWNYKDSNAPLKKYCGYKMFYNCTVLTTAPELPTTILANSCYDSMFYGCTALTSAQSILPATTLANSCYDCMFYNCTVLSTTPELPATTLADYCYQYMFYNCTVLSTATELPATELSSYCYYNMFAYCTSLTTAPELPATTLASYCYSGMFYGCTSLTTAPELPAATLVSYCYDFMFNGCRSLNCIKCLATNNSASSCTSSWVYNVSSTGTFIKHVDMASWSTGANGIPSGWTVEDSYTP